MFKLILFICFVYVAYRAYNAFANISQRVRVNSVNAPKKRFEKTQIEDAEFRDLRDTK
jgi:uncharacterized membrane protein